MDKPIELISYANGQFQCGSWHEILRPSKGLFTTFSLHYVHHEWKHNVYGAN